MIFEEVDATMCAVGAYDRDVLPPRGIELCPDVEPEGRWEAREILGLGKLIGMETVGNEERIIKDIARIIEAREKK
ncbi:hypothetical protein V6N13_142446 [Hibiscus sabdariffa]